MVPKKEETREKRRQLKEEFERRSQNGERGCIGHLLDDLSQKYGLSFWTTVHYVRASTNFD